MAVLVATLGGSWQVVPELYGFTNPQAAPLYRESPDARAIADERHRHGIRAVDEIWLVSTARGQAAREPLGAWARAVGGVPVRLWWPEGLEDLRSARDARAMAELIFRIVWHARQRHETVHLGVAGGRKTMSADLQRAGELMGWSSLLHVIDRFADREQAKRFTELDPKRLAVPLEKDLAGAVLPVVVAGTRPPSDLVSFGREGLDRVAGALCGDGAVRVGAPRLVAAVEDLVRRAAALAANHALALSGEDAGGAFRALYALPARCVEALRSERIGADPARREEDLSWLRQLPKAELHCHLGGVLDVAGMVRVAAAEERRVRACRRRDPQFERELAEVEAMVAADDLDRLRRFLGQDREDVRALRKLRYRWQVPEPLGVCGFLLAFRGREALLDRMLYGARLDPAAFHGIGIERYEALGDLQGSALLQSVPTLRAAVAEAARAARADGVRYLELRCSPANCTRGGLDAREVVTTLVDAIDGVGDEPDMRLIFIASRHGEPDRAAEHVALATALLDEDPRFAARFVGFDLAGAEGAASPAGFRKLFRPLHERVVRLTIHAGEDQPVANVWEAVYELSADRIGHGLTLRDAPELLARFRDRRIAVEMCPSSNFQVVGFADRHLGVDGPTYPLAGYLEEGLRVTVNTDDPGISRTTLSREFLKAAAMTDGGLTRWQVLQLVRNGFRAAFCGHRERHEHMRRAEQQVVRALAGG